MDQLGHVVSVKDGMAYMEVTRKGACGSACATCTNGACESKTEYIAVPNELGAKVGDWVELYVNDTFVLRSIYKLYGIPLAIFLIAVFAGQYLIADSVANRDLYIFGLGFLSLLISYFVLKRADAGREQDTSPRMKRIM
ncbi:Positive regulator of sigma E activity [Aedoeadaptatus ivorii]|uniref:Positive regulator of sigma E activity n=1 Tax=Aedoeadaptatus ivorii TaxID=54006 RepID=A0A3S4YPJ0_9FIRM|nr:SoxR reducing system RseC family protein [Peptoniphilus ivorii]MDQ0507856.1 sigma-E factor negative regulatory protein RseC [Peptoniphilus ivorii]VEJ35683.1 Positive regulator of sigma E activity [Peptoniphilus ivorii]